MWRVLWGIQLLFFYVVLRLLLLDVTKLHVFTLRCINLGTGLQDMANEGPVRAAPGGGDEAAGKPWLAGECALPAVITIYTLAF